MAEKNTAFHDLSELIDKFNTQRETMTVNELQELRENIALSVFYMSDDASKAVANSESKDFERKRFYAEREEHYRNLVDERTGKYFNVADSERKARLDAQKIDEACAFAVKQKERVRLVILATQQILNSIAMRINQLSKN